MLAIETIGKRCRLRLVLRLGNRMLGVKMLKWIGHVRRMHARRRWRHVVRIVGVVPRCGARDEFVAWARPMLLRCQSRAGIRTVGTADVIVARNVLARRVSRSGEESDAAVVAFQVRMSRIRVGPDGFYSSLISARRPNICNSCVGPVAFRIVDLVVRSRRTMSFSLFPKLDFGEVAGRSAH